MSESLRAVKGMNDILPASVPRTEKLPDSGLWQWFESCVRTVMRSGLMFNTSATTCAAVVS